MKYLTLIFLAVQFNLAIAQTDDPIPSTRMLSAISSSMANTCKIDRDSNQCEIFQLLFGEQSEIINKALPQPKSKTPDEIKKSMVKIREEQEKEISFMESSGKMRASRMYGALKLSAEQICNTDPKSKPCDIVLSALIVQTEIETGKRLNPPPRVPVEEKRKLRKQITQNYPKLTESSKLAMESLVLWDMMNPNK